MAWSVIKKYAALLILVSGCIACCGKIPEINSYKKDKVKIVDADEATYMIGASLQFLGIDTGLSASGSGFGISYRGNETVVMTAGHVCSELGEKNDFFTTVFSVITFEGKVFPAKDVIISDEQDLCAITIEGHIPITKLSKNEPTVGDKIFYSGYPLGMYMPGTRHYFDGYMAGKDDELNHLYNIPVVGGASGSPVYNKNKEVVGIISAVLIDFEHITLGVGLLNIEHFLEINGLVN